MGKDKRPRKPKPPALEQSPSDEELVHPTQSKGDLQPPARRPPTAVGADSLPPLPHRPTLPPRRDPPARARPVLYELLATIRAAVGAMLDIADAAAHAITERLEGRDAGVS
jgi:hypothetical protein